MGATESVATQYEGVLIPAPTAGHDLTCTIKGDLPFSERLDLVTQDLRALEIEVQAIEHAHHHYESHREQWPAEIKESEEETKARRKSEWKECIRLEEMLTRVQITLDGIKLPRSVNSDGESMADPHARQERKNAIQRAESLIQRVHCVRTQCR